MKRFSPSIESGLTLEQVKLRYRENLVNYDNNVPTKSYKSIILGNIFTLFNLINIVLGLLVLLTGTIKNLTFLGVVFCNTIISMFQELKAKRTIDSLALISKKKVNVIRDSKITSIDINEIVLDDIIKFKLGDQIVVDSIIKDGLVEVDESFLTGESEPILKGVGDKLLSGSFIVSGNCTVLVDGIGVDSYANKIAMEAKYLKSVNSEIMTTLNKIIKFISVIIIPLGFIFFFRQYNISSSINESILATVAALIGTIPEGLVLLTSTVLAISSVRLAKRKVLVQELYCIETLARVDTICLDKTGTLTNGKMKVIDVVSLNNKYDINNIMDNIVNYMDDGNSTSLALSTYFKKSNSFDFVNKIAFSSSKKYSVYEFRDNTYIVGSINNIDYIGDIPSLDKYKDYRVLFVGVNKEHIINNSISGKFIPLALIIIEDEIRENAKETIEYFISEDVDIKIISGDNISTIESIAKKIGLKDIRICDMSKISNENLTNIVENYNIFGRVSPHDKKRLVLALKENGHKVAMTGDGVNDVLALKESDCSISLAQGSLAARNISQIVLLDSDFKAIPKIVKEGRRAINNLERSASLFLTKTIYAIMLAFLFVFINMDYPFIPIQLTLINIVTIGIPSFVLALEPNYNRVKGRFLIKIITRSIPAAITIFINIISIMILSNLFNFKDDYISTMSVLLVAFTGFILLFKVCFPFNYLRGTLYGCLVGIFLGGILGLSKLFELVLLTPYQFLFIGILCFIDIIVFNLLNVFCEKKILKYEERILK